MDARDGSAGPRWSTIALGLVAVAAGAALTLKPFSSLTALTVYIAVSLAAVGAGELLASRRSPNPWPDRVAGGVLIVAGVAALALPDLTVRGVAVLVGAALVAGGAARLVATFRGAAEASGYGGRYAAATNGLARMIFGGLALTWPDVTVLVLALLVGPVAVLWGLGRIVEAWRLRGAKGGESSEPDGARRHPLLRALGATASLAVALLLLGLSALIHDRSPEVDDFYAAPSDLPSEPGVLLRTEPFTRSVPDGSQGWRILFTTEDRDGGMRVASALVMASLDAPAGPRPTLLWTHGTTGVAEDCAPTLLPDPVAAGGMPAVEQALDRGWAVVAPDYTGLGTEGPHPYLIGSPEATSSLDAVRAARQLAGLELGEETVVWGHSQGGGAALWVGIEAPRYAPDVPLAGVAGLAPAGDLVSLAAGLQRSPGGNLFATYVLSAYADWYEDVAFEDYVRPAALTTARAIASRCINEPAVFLSVAALLPGEGLFARDLASGPLRERLAQNVPGEPTSTPTFVGQGEADELVLPDVQRRFAQRLCEGGQAIDYRSYAGRDHVSVVADDSPLVPALLRWTEARFAGETPAPGCAFRRG